MVLHLQGVNTTVNITTVLAVISTTIVLGGLIWRLASRISTLEAKVDMNQAKTDSEIKHVLEVINLRLQISDDKDKQILDSLALMNRDMKSIHENVGKLMTDDAITKAINMDRLTRKDISARKDREEV